MTTRRFVVTGAPGTGKTTLLGALSDRVAVVREPARDLIADHRRRSGEESLDARPSMFVRLLVERSIGDFDAMSAGVVLFDRGLGDWIAYAEMYGIDSTLARTAATERRYDDPVFILPPWRAIHSTDDMRRISFDDVPAFHDRLVAAYTGLGHDVVEVPPGSVSERAGFVLHVLDSAGIDLT